ncbi:MAG: hypothetical protein JW810_03645 [Sedimentisphaerales bacterium]|nr:hypothetical protein [Sedimentisphaerales bacterium]
MSETIIQLGHSPDCDDAFMFYGLASGAVDTGPWRFEHVLRDIQTLNEWARAGKLEVTAVSVHAYAYLQETYAVLASGASMGATDLADYLDEDGNRVSSDDFTSTGIAATETEPQSSVAADRESTAQGPLLLAREPLRLEEVKTRTIAIPGELTTAFLTLRLALGEFAYQVMDFDEIMPAVAAGRVDAGLIIHEGQLTYRQRGLSCLLDLGRWWFEQTGLPLPLGCNLIRRDLGDDAMRQISRILQESIRYSLAHRRAAIDYALQFGRDLDADQADRFIGLYVNRWTLDYGPAGRRALTELLCRGHGAGILPAVETIDFY